MKEPLIRIVHKVIDRSLVHRVASRERYQKQDLWIIIADHLYKHAPGTKENSVICAGYNVTKIACFLGYCVDDEIKKCSEPIDCKYWISKMLADELDVENTCLKKETEMPTQAEEGSSELRKEHGGLNSSWGDWNASLSEIERGNVWRDSMLIQNNYMLEHSMPILYHLADQGNQSNQGGSYGLGGDDYFTSTMPDFGGSSSGYAVGGSSRGAGFNDDDDMDEPIWNSKICTLGHKHVVWIGPMDKKLIGRRKTRKSKNRTLRRALCRQAGGIATLQEALPPGRGLDWISAQRKTLPPVSIINVKFAPDQTSSVSEEESNDIFDDESDGESLDESSEMK
ncbi:hypothetical protein Tco_0942301 [Tanacetum coccineum]